MKKILCFIMSIILFASFVIPSVYSAESEESSKNLQQSVSDAVSYTCMYDVNSSSIVIDGSVRHDFLISHSDYKIRVYSIDTDVQYVGIPENADTSFLAESDMTVRFTFSIAVNGILDRYSMYLIVLCSPEGEYYSAGEPMLPSISTSFEYDRDDRSCFKGILIDTPSDIGSSKAGNVVVDIDISQTLGNAADGIPLQMSNSFINIKKSYVAAIDKKIMMASLQGSRVYLRLLLGADNKELSNIYYESSEQYTLPALHNEYALEYIFTISRFFAQRYQGDKQGSIYGIIVGKAIDDLSVNTIGNMDMDSYADLYTMYLVVVGNAVRAERTDLDMVIPLSDANDYSNETKKSWNASALLEKIIHRLDKNVSGTFSCSVLIESTHSPLTEGERHTLQRNRDISKITADNIDEFVSYLSSLQLTYQSVPTNVIFLWTPEASLGGNLLSASYILNYTKLLPNTNVSSFVVNLSSVAYREIKNIIRNIDTEHANEVLNATALAYGYSSWQGLVEENVSLPVNHVILEKDFVSDCPINAIGSFTYMDFTSTSIYSQMSAGDNCTYIRSEYNSDAKRVLSLVSGEMAMGDTAEAICVFEYPENYGYTPYMSLNIGISDANASENALYRITLTLGAKDIEQTVTGIIKNGETRELFFDASEFSELSMADYVKISTSCLTEDTHTCSVMLSELRGYSAEYDTDTLTQLIEAERLELRNESVDDDEGFDFVLLITIIGIVFALAVTAVGLVVLFKRDEH